MFVKVERKNRYGEYKAMLVSTEEIVAIIEKTHRKFNDNGDEIDTTILKKEYVLQLKNGNSHIVNEESYNSLITQL